MLASEKLETSEGGSDPVDSEEDWLGWMLGDGKPWKSLWEMTLVTLVALGKETLLLLDEEIAVVVVMVGVCLDSCFGLLSGLCWSLQLSMSMSMSELCGGDGGEDAVVRVMIQAKQPYCRAKYDDEIETGQRARVRRRCCSW